MRDLIQEFDADRGSLSRLYTVECSPARRERFRRLFEDWQARLAALPFEDLDRDGRIDHVAFSRYLARQIRELDLQAERLAKIAPLLPFAQRIVDLEEARRRLESIDAAKAAADLDRLVKHVAEVQRELDATPVGERHEAAHAVEVVRALKKALEGWFKFYEGYDPAFTWWAAEPYKAAQEALDGYVAFLREKIVGVKADDERAIVGNPVGWDALMADLEYEMIPYTPEELIVIGEREYAWCEAELKRAAREMGYGDDWRAAMEHVKNLHVEPGKQTELVRDYAHEAVKFLEDRDLVTVPPLAKETWRMEMMSPERQLVNPFFLGGETIIVSYPTNTMSHDQKLMSMRGNNAHFSRATVQHELIPGHHLQMFSMARHKPYRRVFYTPFWIEGWALYWEMRLWDLGFPRGPEDRIGMLFWRIHRAARIVFSLKFHLGQMTADECIDMLVDRVGHERANAEGEVRRSFNGNYPPLYQAAYMIGGLQLRALHEEIVGAGRMTDRQFHDAILKQNTLPWVLVRAALLDREEVMTLRA